MAHPEPAEVPMAERVPVNTADFRQLLELPGVGLEQAERIVQFRWVHGPIVNDSELSRVLGWRALDGSLWGRVDSRSVCVSGHVRAVPARSSLACSSFTRCSLMGCLLSR